jgi:hypothetical protein
VPNLSLYHDSQLFHRCKVLVRSAGAALRGAVEALPPPAAAAAAAAYVQTALAVRTPSPRALFARLPRAGFRPPT